MTLAAFGIARGLALGVIALVLTNAPVAAHEGQLCIRAIRAVEHTFDLPPGLLMAVALTETGRRVGDAHTPWPWSINAAGEGVWLDGRRAAIERARALQARGIESIDVGCMQVNLKWHETAFDSLESAFDPGTNVAYAARYLTELRARSQSWLEAAGYYHSSDPARARPYRARLTRNWTAVLAGLEAPMLLPPAPGQIPLDFALAPPDGLSPLVDLTGSGRESPLVDTPGRPLLGLVPAHGAGPAGP